LPRAEDASVWIADVRGRRVRVMGSGPLPAGPHVLVWDGHDDSGREVRSGIYFVVLEAEDRRLTRRMVTVR
jgi:hypothetical protein